MNYKYIDALHSISPNIPNDDWVKTGMACKAENMPFNVWDDWSSKGETYDPKRAKAVWHSISDTGGVTGGTLLYMAGKTANNGNIQAPPSDLKKASNAKALVNKVNALDIFASYPNAVDTHPYIVKKQGCADGLKVVPDDSNEKINGINVAGALVIPCYEQSSISTLQYIINSHKLNPYGYKFGEGYFIQGVDRSEIYVCEGIGQLWAAIEATGKSAVSTFGIGRTNRVVSQLRLENPDSQIILVADKGQELTTQTIAKQHQCKFITMPDGWEKNSDINDLLLKDGRAALVALLSKAKDSKPNKEDAKERLQRLKEAMKTDLTTIDKYSNRSHYIDGLLVPGHHTVLYGAAGSFKTTATAALCLQALDKFPLLEVHYWGFDCSQPFIEAIVKHINHDRFFIFSQQTANDMQSFYKEYIENDLSLNNIIIVLDTYKFLSTDINNKNANKAAMHFIKSVCKLGAAWISLGHSNKNGESQSGTAEVEQDSDGLLKIQSEVVNGKAYSTIEKAGRCRWGDASISLETIITIEDKESPHLFWLNAIQNLKITSHVDVALLKSQKEKQPQMEVIAKVINDEYAKNRTPINKTSLKKLINDNDFISLSQRDIEKTLYEGNGKYWQIEANKEKNQQLFKPVSGVRNA